MATHGVTFDGVTEVRPGVYVFQDMFQVGIGSCSINALALSVLASVIANNRDRGTLILDAGGLALSKDRSTSNSDFDAGPHQNLSSMWTDLSRAPDRRHPK